MNKPKVIVEYYRYRYPNNQNEDCYDIYIENEEDKTREYLCGGFDIDQVNVARFVLEKYISKEYLLINNLKVNDKVEVCGESGTWYNGIITNISDNKYEVLVSNEKEQLTVNIEDLNKIRLKKEV